MRTGTKSSDKAKRGRPRAFDEHEVVERITDLFWRQGFAATSLDDISRVSGVGRPSLYATFGDKEAMYLAAMESFVTRIERALATVRFEELSLEEALDAFLEGLLRLYESHDESSDMARGCLVICTAVTEAIAHPPVRAAVQKILANIDNRFVGLLEAARARGEIADDVDTAALASVLSSTVHSLALRSRAGASRAHLRRLARGSIAVVLAAGRPTKAKARAGSRR